MLQPATPDTIRASLPLIEQHAQAISRCFYHLLFNQHPELRALFNPDPQAMARQQQALARALITSGQQIDHLDRLEGAINQIAHTHCRHNVQPAHYKPVGECLITAIAQVLGPQASDAVLAAWTDLYIYLSTVLIQAERARYQAGKGPHNGYSAL